MFSSAPPNLDNLYNYQNKLKNLKVNLTEFSKINIYVSQIKSLSILL